MLWNGSRATGAFITNYKHLNYMRRRPQAELAGEVNETDSLPRISELEAIAFLPRVHCTFDSRLGLTTQWCIDGWVLAVDKIMLERRICGDMCRHAPTLQGIRALYCFDQDCWCNC
jgi:hypothetical protein